MGKYDFKLVVIFIITFSGFLLAFLTAIGQLISDRKSPKTWLFVLLFLIFCLFQIHYIVGEIGILEIYKIFNLFPIAALLLLGPTIMNITKHAVQEQYILKKSDLWHFVPAVIVSLASLYIIYNTEHQQLDFLHGYYYNRYIASLGLFGGLLFTFYLLWAGRILLKSYLLSKKVILKNPPALITFIVLLFFVLALFSDIAAISFNSKIFMEFTITILTLIIIFLFLIVFKYPDYYKTLRVVVKDEKQKRWYLNDIIGEKFSSFINRHRVEAAKNLLIKNPDENIIIIAYEVGFKSKSTFNASFAKFEKLTPRAYRQKHLK